ncbi:Gfo/Idh/MocA family protein [Paenibacillus sp. MMS18-CY102]|uniref:Gfo/Idh/MocA family protein n=1 Tax=Paenibacillus sp. MMS18-CY102 TaxID=2682849 RepID=UPI001366020E|nr:Gfo/Idh/MocA family oxidoreductase [Paenibacillus sp. MMS18-CY102]MWC27902.1 gfo/Idh/MocA family oxidoreductase [Paenibacillus sp. MMS18-CY102]
MNPIKIGVIGTGSISSLHLQAYSNNKQAKLAAICDINQERAKQTAKQYGVDKTYFDYRELLADPDIDAVSICTRNDTHAPISIAALEAGKHVLIEKPLARNVEEALAIQEAARRSGRILQVGFVRRYDPNVQLLQQFADQGEFGELYYAKASTIRRLGNPGGWFADVTRSGGGPLIDIGVHAIDLCWYLMGRPNVRTVSANTYTRLGNRSNIQHLSFYKAADYDANLNTVEDLANAIIRFDNGASLMVDVSYTLHAKQDEGSIRLYGEKGGFEIDPAIAIVTEKHNTILNIQPQTDSSAGFNADAAFGNEINHFIQCIATGAQPISPVEDGVAMTKILCAIYESAASGKEVQL